MDFEVDQWAVHPRHGVGRITKVESKHFDSGPEQQYYRFEIASGTVWVPVDNAATGLRKLFAKKDLALYRALLRSRPVPLEGDFRQRKIDLAARQQESSVKARCELVRDLSAFGWKKGLNEISSIMLRSTRQALCAEWAAVAGLPIEKARLEIEELLHEGRRVYEQEG